MEEEQRRLGRTPATCPSCDERLAVTRLSCANCGTEVTGTFPPGRLDELSADDRNFVLLFVRRKGNLKEMERDLGISYWTLRRRLDEIAASLDGSERGDEQTDYRGAVVRRLHEGELSVEQALELLRAAGAEAVVRAGTRRLKLGKVDVKPVRKFLAATRESEAYEEETAKAEQAEGATET